jgi:hypothetical protein
MKSLLQWLICVATASLAGTSQAEFVCPTLNLQPIEALELGEAWALAHREVVSSRDGLSASLWRLDEEFVRLPISEDGLNARSLLFLGLGDIDETPLAFRLYSTEDCRVAVKVIEPNSISVGCLVPEIGGERAASTCGERRFDLVKGSILAVD